MRFSEINPFLRYAKVQPAVAEGDRFHMAYDCRLFYILEGGGTLFFEEESIALAPGNAIFFLPGAPYRFAGHLKILAVNFDLTQAYAHEKKPRAPEEAGTFRKEEMLAVSPPPELSERVFLPHASAVEPLLKQCVCEHLCPSVYADALTSALLKQALVVLLEGAREGAPELPKTVRDIMLYLRENFDRPLHNEEIGAAFGYHPFYLNRLFKRYTGKTLHKTLTEIRVRQAKSLLLRTSLSVEQIVRETGFSDRTQFSASFRKVVGMSATEYRKRERKRQGEG